MRSVRAARVPDLLEVDDRAGEGAGDALDGLDARDHELAEVVHGLGFRAHDDVVRTRDVVGLGHAVDGAHLVGHGCGLADFGLDQDVRMHHGRPPRLWGGHATAGARGGATQDDGGLVFGNRRAAGERLAPLIAAHVRAPAVVLGIPRGGVVVAAAAAGALGWPLGAVVTKKLGAPGNPELGIGAVAPGVRVLEADVIAALGVSDEWIDREAARVEADVRERAAALGSAVPQDLHGVTAVIVDDGVATGGTARAAGRWARARGAAVVVLAVPVAPQNVEARVGDAFDVVLAIETPSSFGAVGQFFADFDQVGDAEMRDALEGAAP